MRVVAGEIEFSAYLLNIGNGMMQVYPEVSDDVIRLPDEYLIGSMETLISRVFPMIDKGYPDKYFVSR